MPGCRERSGLRFAVTHNTRRDEVGIIEHCSKRVGEAVSQFAPFVNRTRRFRGAMAPNAARDFLADRASPESNNNKHASMRERRAVLRH